MYARACAFFAEVQVRDTTAIFLPLVGQATDRGAPCTSLRPVCVFIFLSFLPTPFNGFIPLGPSKQLNIFFVCLISHSFSRWPSLILEPARSEENSIKMILHRLYVLHRFLLMSDGSSSGRFLWSLTVECGGTGVLVFASLER